MVLTNTTAAFRVPGYIRVGGKITVVECAAHPPGELPEITILDEYRSLVRFRLFHFWSQFHCLEIGTGSRRL
jgi:hypothetical protein